MQLLLAAHSFFSNDQLQVEAGLGDSEFLYTMVVAAFNVGALVSSLLMGILVKCVPYWYLFVSSLCLFVLGSLLYALAHSTWMLMVAQFLVGHFLGSNIALSYSYASKSSVEYVHLKEGRFNEEKSAKIRDLLFAVEGVGGGVGFFIGPGE